MDSWLREIAQPLRAVTGLAAHREEVWPFTIPVVAQILSEGLTLEKCTVIVGDNGSGKSTVVEAIAEAYGLNPEGGSQNAIHTTRRTESELFNHFALTRGGAAARSGFFIRAETMHGLFTYLESIGLDGLHNRSHGEAFLDLITSRCFGPHGVPKPGLYIFDEVESALSYSSSLQVLAMFTELARADGVQLIVATHSPILAAIPDAKILQFDETGITHRAWEDLDLVIGERAFLANPQSFLRHLQD